MNILEANTAILRDYIAAPFSPQEVLTPRKKGTTKTSKKAKRSAVGATVLIAADQKKNLQRISGVGPTLEKRLQSLGIDSYAHISSWNAADIKKVEEHLNFKGRIKRDAWVRQAKQLVKEQGDLVLNAADESRPSAAPAPGGKPPSGYTHKTILNALVVLLGVSVLGYFALAFLISEPYTSAQSGLLQICDFTWKASLGGFLGVITGKGAALQEEAKK